MTKKIFIHLIAVLISTSSYCQTSAEWQSDLRQLQQIVHTKYSNLFYNISDANWDKAVDVFYNEIPGLKNDGVLAGFIKLVALFHIGHTQINSFGLHHGASSLQLNRLPYQLYWFNDGVYILSAAKKYEQAVGGKVIKIGKLKTEDALAAIRPLVSFENEQGFKSNSMFFLATPEFLKTQGISETSSEVSITYLKDGKEETVLVNAEAGINGFSMTGLETAAGWAVAKRTTSNIPLWQKEPASFRFMEFLPERKTLYVRHSVNLNDGDKTIAAFFTNMAGFIEKNDVQKLVLDIRTNGGGNNQLNKPMITSIIRSVKINQKGKFFCIIGRRTFSAAQNLVNELEKYTEVTFIGEPTSENVNFYGDTRTETLNNSKLQANLSWMWWQNLDPRDRRKATSPELAVDMSFDDYYNNEDPALKAIFNYENEKPIAQILADKITAGDKAGAIHFAVEYKKDPRRRYVADRLEAEINREGYNKLQSKHIDIANALFEINTKVFPESANAYDSYAECLMAMGKKEEALKNYQIAIDKDKDGVTAENAKKMIEKIKNN
ncbi:MAG: hypothetical protein IPO01_18825 [Chitinophagaceae bacterium]|nr:hypothetical protein [Chitinophagaceae bacterium]